VEGSIVTPRAFSAKFEFVLKALCLSRGRVAAELGIDKSVVGRWARGAVRPSADNLARLTALVAARVAGFTILDWERDPASLARVLGVDPDTAPGLAAWPLGPLGEGPHRELLDQILATTQRRGAAYEGFYRSTRPYAGHPGRFIHDRMMIRKDDNALLRFDLRCGRVGVEGWVLPQQNQLFVVGAETASGSLAFGIFNGVSATQAGLIDGLLLGCALDANRTPTAHAMVFERAGDLTGDEAGDEARFAELAADEGVAPAGSVPADLAAHLTRDIGPAQAALGGDWLLALPLTRSLSRGVAEEEGAPDPPAPFRAPLGPAGAPSSMRRRAP
jgi:transcriptional regulator with XRE-family HTH domain